MQPEVRGKTEQRVEHIIHLLKTATAPMTYEEIRLASGSRKRDKKPLIGGVSYDMLLFVMTTLCELGLVERTENSGGKGHPRYYFHWKANKKAAQALGVRLQSAS